MILELASLAFGLYSSISSSRQMGQLIREVERLSGSYGPIINDLNTVKNIISDPSIQFSGSDAYFQLPKPIYSSAIEDIERFRIDNIRPVRSIESCTDFAANCSNMIFPDASHSRLLIGESPSEFIQKVTCPHCRGSGLCRNGNRKNSDSCNPCRNAVGVDIGMWRTISVEQCRICEGMGSIYVPTVFSGCPHCRGSGLCRNGNRKGTDSCNPCRNAVNEEIGMWRNISIEQCRICKGTGLVGTNYKLRL